MVLKVRVKEPTAQTPKSGKSFDIFGRGHSKDRAERDLGLAVKDTERALGFKLGSPLVPLPSCEPLPALVGR